MLSGYYNMTCGKKSCIQKKKAKEIAMKVCSSSLAVTVADVVNP